MDRFFLARRYEIGIKIGTALACLVALFSSVAPAQDENSSLPLPATPAIPDVGLPPMEDQPAAEEPMQEEEPVPEETAPAAEKPVEQLLHPPEAEPTPPPVQPIFPWNQGNANGGGQTLFGPPLSGFGIDSRLTVNPSRPSVARIYSGLRTQLDSGGGTYNLAAGRVRFRFSAGLRLEANSNVNLTSTNPESDLIVQPQIAVQGTWRLTKINSLDITMSFGKSFYLIHPNLDQTTLQIAPGSQIALNVFAGDFRFNLHDRFSVEQDPVAVSGLNNTANAGLFTNDVGLTTTWDLNELILSLDLDHANFNSIQAQPTYANRASNSVALYALTAIARAVNAGVELNVTSNTYSGQNINLPANSNVAFAGLFTEGRMSRFITVRAGGGYEVAYVDAIGSTPSSRIGGYYANLALTQLINPWCNQTLDIGHEIAANVYSSAEQNTYFHHSMGFKIFRRASFSTQLAYEKVTSPSGTNSSNYSTYGGGIQWNYQLTKKLSLDTQFQMVYRVSNVQGQNYSQNRLVLDFAYQF